MHPIKRTACGFAPLAGCLLLLISPLSAAEFQKTTHIYKTVGDVDIAADVYRPADDQVRPVLVWIHGGALIVGSRESVPANLIGLCQTEGFALVSVDYRLAPEVKLPEIATDLDDAFLWLRDQGPALLKIDPDRMVIAGGSAGGFCTLLATARMKQKPKAIVSYWGYGEFLPDWAAAKSKDHGDPVAMADAVKGVNAGIITAPTKEQGQARGLFYRYTRQNGLWGKTVTGFDPLAQPAELKQLSPVNLITRDFPPTLMIHGTHDTDVPYLCATRLATALKSRQVPYELVTVENAGHGLSGGDQEQVAAAHATALNFIRRHLKSSQ